jgi:HAD superfamily hydrolase (TIGR01509 family)
MDGTLFDTEKLRLQLFKQASKTLRGFELSDEYLLACLGLNEDSAAQLAQQYYAQDIGFHEIRQYVHVLEQQYVAQNGVPLKAGVLELLQAFKAREIKIALATSNRRCTVKDYLQRSGLDQFFEVVVCGDEVQNGKPHPEIFLKVVQKLDVSAQHCFMFEDSENGLHSAYQAGGVTVLIPDIKPATAQMRSQADYIYASLADVLADLDCLMN